MLQVQVGQPDRRSAALPIINPGLDPSPLARQQTAQVRQIDFDAHTQKDTFSSVSAPPPDLVEIAVGEPTQGVAGERKKRKAAGRVR